MSDIIVGLDIGYSFIRIVVGEFTENDTIQIVGTSKVPSPGLRNGTIPNIEATLEAIKIAIGDVEMISGYEVHSCVCSIGGSHIESENSKGVATVSNKGNSNREITEEDMARAIDISKVKALPPDRQIIHVIPRSYIVDGQEGIRDPKNMLGVRLEAESHLVTGSSTSIGNVQKCLRRGDYTVDRIMLKTLAATQAVMTEDELELGSILIDLGGGSTDVLVLIGGSPICALSIPVGSSYATNDIAYIKGISFETAESIKLKSGCCWEPLLDEAEEVIIPGVGGRSPEAISRNEICQILQARMEEIFNMVRSEIVKKTKITSLSGNVVLVGGGSQLPGISELAQHVFKTTSVRLGVPGNLGGIVDEYRKPEYATAVGLVVGNTDLRKRIDTKRNNKYNDSNTSKKGGENFGEKLSRFLGEFF
ncbi:MAG: cell division protein FtsA [Spirochaetaceae bacterium]|nr:cell division protein FtsA [Spirochaetaceae bacterium]